MLNVVDTIHWAVKGSNPCLLRVNHICYPLFHGLVVQSIVVMLLLKPMTVRSLEQFLS